MTLNPSAYGGRPLTRREQQALDLIAAGYSQRETARLMDVAVPTVSQYVQQCKHKYEARNVYHLIVLYITQQIENRDR